MLFYKGCRQDTDVANAWTVNLYLILWRKDWYLLSVLLKLWKNLFSNVVLRKYQNLKQIRFILAQSRNGHGSNHSSGRKFKFLFCGGDNASVTKPNCWPTDEDLICNGAIQNTAICGV